MRRRTFLNVTFATVGGVLIGRDISRAAAFDEVAIHSSEGDLSSGYDLVINGCGIAGCFAALEASRKGLKVLILDKRTYPGFEMTAKRRLWLDIKGAQSFHNDFLDLFLPDAESGEVEYKGDIPRNSRFGDEVIFFAGSIKKGLLRNLLVNNIHVMFMTDVCGIMTEKKAVKGVLVAGRHGMYTIDCKVFIDASDNLFFTRQLFDGDCDITKAGFVMEWHSASYSGKQAMEIPVNDADISGNKVVLHKGKRNEGQVFVEFSFDTKSFSLNLIEQKARDIAKRLSKYLPENSEIFKNAVFYHSASECSYTVNGDVPDVKVNSYYCFSKTSLLSCQDIINTANEAGKIVSGIILSNKASDNKQSGDNKQGGEKQLLYIGGSIAYTPKGECVSEAGLTLPLLPFSFNRNMSVETVSTSLLIAGGGTAGASAALGALENGAKVLLAEYFYDLGGTKTVSGVTTEYFGYQDNEWYKKQKGEIKAFTSVYRMSPWQARAYYLRSNLSHKNCGILCGVIICGALTEGKKLKSVITCENGKLILINSDLTVDCTGESDIAYFAGEKYELGNSRTGKTQDYSQWDIPVKNMPTHNHRDFDIVDFTKISEFQRALFLTHYESHFYDFYPMIGIRESRRPNGVYRMNVADVLDGARFDDTIVVCRSDFDPHYTGSSEFSRCGFLLPHSNVTTAEIPYRSLVPASIDGLLLSARGISLTHNALQYTRMSADVIVIGYVSGQIAANCVSRKISPRNFDVSRLRKKWIKEKVLSQPEIVRRRSVEDAINDLIDEKSGALFACCRFPKQEILSVLLHSFDIKPSLQLAQALAWHGSSVGAELLEKELTSLFAMENAEGYPDGYVEKYDENSVYWQINRNISLLAMSGAGKIHESVYNILRRTTSGGGMVSRDNDYDNNRIDMVLISYYNRIMNLCFYAERITDNRFIPYFDRLLSDKNIGGYKTEKYNKTRWRVYNADLELFIASSTARCGGKHGLITLAGYLDDIHSDFRDFARGELKEVSGKDFEYNKSKWESHINSLSYPYKTTPLKKEIEY